MRMKCTSQEKETVRGIMSAPVQELTLSSHVRKPLLYAEGEVYDETELYPIENGRKSDVA